MTIRPAFAQTRGDGRVVLRWFAQFYHGQQGPLLRRFPPRPYTRAGDDCLAVQVGEEIVRTTTSRQDAGAGCCAISSLNMIAYEASLTYQLINFDAADRLATTKHLLAYLTTGIPDKGSETFWVACLNPNRRPICRAKIASGILVTCQVSVRDVWRVILLAEAKVFAVLRTQRDATVRPNLADGRLMFNLRETARLMNVEFLDYIIVQLDGGDYHSCRDRGELHD